MRAKDALGRYGELVAERYLLDHGFTIIDRNWRCRAGELDLVAREGTVLVFCEVKTRSSTAFGDPAEAVSNRKAVRLQGLAVQWLTDRRARVGAEYWPELRFDVVCVLRPRQGAASVRHVRGAF